MFFLYLYLSTLIVGGTLLMTTVLFGGDHNTDADVDADLDIDHDLDLDHDVDVDHDVDLDHDVEMDHDVESDLDHGGELQIEQGGLPGPASQVWLPFFSLRFWVFFSTFFGLTGTVLTGLKLAGSISTLVLAVLIGFISGTSAAYVIKMLKKSETGTVLSVCNFIGQEAQVTIPLSHDRRGKIKVELHGQVRELTALNIDDAELARGLKVTIIRCDEKVAWVQSSERFLSSDDNRKKLGS